MCFGVSNDPDWGLANSDDARAEIRAAVEYLLRDTSNTDRTDRVLELIQIAMQVMAFRPAIRSMPVSSPAGPGLPAKPISPDPN